ncbi:MAG TPA: hypothetical protein ENK18_07465 [Deltaproteobacteria bacterium]|nr:hypothetical protein [Deltaproteobacteria bacterium]
MSRPMDTRWIQASRSGACLFLVLIEADDALEIDLSEPLASTTWGTLARHCQGAFEPLVQPCGAMAGVIEDPGAAGAIALTAQQLHRQAQQLWPQRLDVDWGDLEARRQRTDPGLAVAWGEAADRAPEAEEGEILSRTLALLGPELSAVGPPLELDPGEDDGAVILDELTRLLSAEQALWRGHRRRGARRVGLARHALGALASEGWSAAGHAGDASLRRAAGALVLLQQGWPPG